MERKIGEIFECNGEWYQCVKSDGTCNGCVGKFQPYSVCNGFKECVGKIFKKLEKVGESFPHYCPSGRIIYFQKYKLFDKSYSHNTEYIMCDFNEDGIISIEIKQTKKDMEEKKLNLKPFDIQKAREGKPVCTRDGRKARIICIDRINGDRRIVACVLEPDGDFEQVLFYSDEGYIVDPQHPKGDDLMMIPEKKEGWVNVYPADCMDQKRYSTKEEALSQANSDVIDTVKIKWEE